jgi:hypothetical protein
VRNGFLLPMAVVMAVFRGKLRAAIQQGLAQGTLQLPTGNSRQQMENLLNTLGRTKWHVHMRARYAHGTGVLTYLARYRRGGPLSNTRLVSCAEGEVTFRYRVNGEAADRPRSSLLTISLAEFLRRSLRHVPVPGTRVVRAYGLYAPTPGEALAVCRAQLGQERVAVPVVLDWQTACQERGADHPECCPVCGRQLIRRGVFLPARRPPPRRAFGRRWHDQRTRRALSAGREEWSALAPCPAWRRDTQGNSARLGPTLCAPLHPRAASLGFHRRACSGLKSWYKFHRQVAARCAGRPTRC